MKDPQWLDFQDPEMLACLTCHVELDIKGKTYREVLPKVAAELHKVADKVEADALDTGFHEIKAPNGDEWGRVYLDHYGEGLL